MRTHLENCVNVLFEIYIWSRFTKHVAHKD